MLHRAARIKNYGKSRLSYLVPVSQVFPVVHRCGAAPSQIKRAAILLSRGFCYELASIFRMAFVKVFRLTRWQRLSSSVLLLLMFCGCGSAAAPLSIEMHNPQTNQTLTCAARGQLGQADPAVLATAVESCAKQLEERGFVRAN
jgi:hypothetical protein